MCIHGRVVTCMIAKTVDARVLYFLISSPELRSGLSVITTMNVITMNDYNYNSNNYGLSVITTITVITMNDCWSCYIIKKAVQRKSCRQRFYCYINCGVLIGLSTPKL